MPPHAHAIVPVEFRSVNNKSEKAGKKSTWSELSAICKARVMCRGNHRSPDMWAF
jgi:hypothetical protein